MSDPKDIEKLLFKEVESIGAMQPEICDKNMSKTGRFAPTLMKVGSLETFNDVMM